MAIGENIKQQTSRTSPDLTDILYLVANDLDYSVTLQKIKTLFGIEDVEEWKTQSVASGATEYISFGSALTYGAIKIDYIAKRSGRGQRTGTIIILVDDSNSNGVTVSDSYISRDDEDYIGINLDDGFNNSGVIQLKAVADSSDANPVIFNYQVTSQRPITVS